MKIDLQATGYFCNHWPHLSILINGVDVTSLDVQQDTRTSVQHDSQVTSLEIVHHGKNFGPKVWDTKMVDGKIVEDCYFKITDLRIDGVPMKNFAHYGNYIYDDGRVEPVLEHIDALYFNYNMRYQLLLEGEFYDWVISKTREGFKEVGPSWRKRQINTTPDGYSFSSLELLDLIHDIKQLIDRIP